MKHIADEKSIKGGQYDKVPENYSGTVYICPMHPEVRDVEKSDCCLLYTSPSPRDRG